MTTLTEQDFLHDLAGIVKRVIDQGERFRLLVNSQAVALIPVEYLEVIEDAEDRIDNEEAHLALAEMERLGLEPVPLGVVKQRLGLA